LILLLQLILILHHLLSKVRDDIVIIRGLVYVALLRLLCWDSQCA
jgi:hypothetical protein